MLFQLARTLPLVAPRPAAWAAAAGAALPQMLPSVALAADEAAGVDLPDDRIVVGAAIFLLALTGLLQLSLGDVIGDEAQLPSSTSLINKNKQRRSSFIKGKK